MEGSRRAAEETIRFCW